MNTTHTTTAKTYRPVQTLSRVQGLAASASEPYTHALSPAALCSIELGAIAQWVSDQDDSIRAENIVEVATAAVAWVHGRYPASTRKGRRA
jgi:hypothetical protein